MLRTVDLGEDLIDDAVARLAAAAACATFLGDRVDLVEEEDAGCRAARLREGKGVGKLSAGWGWGGRGIGSDWVVGVMMGGGNWGEGRVKRAEGGVGGSWGLRSGGAARLVEELAHVLLALAKPHGEELGALDRDEVGLDLVGVRVRVSSWWEGSGSGSGLGLVLGLGLGVG